MREDLRLTFVNRVAIGVACAGTLSFESGWHTKPRTPRFNTTLSDGLAVLSL